MKYILLMFLVVGCGKNSMPDKLDLNDTDGDQIANEYEKSGLEKYVAKVVPMEETDLEINFQSNNYIFSNKIDLQRYAKDLLVKNHEEIKANNYFSEFNILRPNSFQDLNLSHEALVRTTFKFSALNSKPKSIFVVYPDHKIYISEWKEFLTLHIPGKILKEVLNGKAFLSISNLSNAEADDIKTLEESVGLKTQRVVVYDGVTTKVHYISKSLDLNGILKYLDILVYQNIDEENLLQQSGKSTKAVWWIRILTNKEIVFVKESARALAEHYLAGFNKQQSQLSRVNGFTSSVMKIKKQASANVLLRIRGMKKNGIYEKNEIVIPSLFGQSSGGGDCKFMHQTFTSVNESQHVENEILTMLKLNQLEVEMRALADAEGPYWEIEIRNNTSDFQLALAPLPATEYMHDGFFYECRPGIKPRPYVPNLQVPERSLTLNIEALVEKI